jgi:hypothetical protein
VTELFRRIPPRLPPMHPRTRHFLAGLMLCAAHFLPAQSRPDPASGPTTPSLQEQLDASPGTPLHLPAGEYRLTEPLVFKTSGSGLFGEGTIIQTNDDADIIQVVGADHVRLEGITLLRENPRFEKSARAIWAEGSSFLTVRNVTVRGNRASPTTVLLNECHYSTVEGCTIIDYKTVTIDDRMKDDLYRYAFRAIDGHGIIVRHSSGTRLIRNRIIETSLRPTEAVMREHDLGRIVDRAPELGPLASYGVKEGFAFIWHQGAGIGVQGPSRTALTLIEGNYIENAAQALDVHSDFMIVTNNHITTCYTGIKVFHGSRGVIISNNIIHRPAKYGIMLRPGSGSWSPTAPQIDALARGENVQRGLIIANNLITDMGYDDEHWRLWNDDPTETSPVGIKVGTGPLPSNPRFRDLILQGNLIHDHGQDGILIDGTIVQPPPRYKWAIWFDEEWPVENVRMSGNIFHAGEKGVSNLPIAP